MTLKEDLIESYPKVAKKLGLTEHSLELGGGAWGYAYQLESGHVLKLTTDTKEVAVSARLKGKKIKHIANILEVYRLPEIPYMKDWFAIIQERLYPLSAHEQEFFWKLHEVFEGTLTTNGLENEIEVAKQNEEGDDGFVKEDLPLLNMCLELSNDLLKMGIYLSDVHGENVLKDKDGNIKIIDLRGFSSKKSKIPKIKNEQLLVDLIREELIKLTLLLSEAPEASKDEVFGQYLFAPERKDTPKPKEPNTRKEIDLKNAMNVHYHGSPSALNPWIKKLDQLKNAGKYEKVLEVPQRYQYAYRFMEVDPKILQQMLGGNKKAIDGQKEKDGKWRSQVGGNFFAGHQSRDHFSWTVNPAIIKKIKEDWGTLLYSKGNKFFVVMRAKIHGGGNDFLLNPDILGKSEIADEYGYQKEVISIGDIKLDQMAYIWVRSNVNSQTFDDETVPTQDKLARGAIRNIKLASSNKKK
jgi:hypothetical protein